ncbi:MAG: hypothetical protein AAGF12_13835 [Myxococcota bacterium]
MSPRVGSAPFLILLPVVFACSIERMGGGLSRDASPGQDASLDRSLIDSRPSGDTGLPDRSIDPPPPDATVDSTRGCTEGELRCRDNRQELCMVDTTWAGWECPQGCFDTTRCRRVVPTNVSSNLFEPLAPSVRVSADVTLNTSTCVPPAGESWKMMVVTQLDATETACVLVARQVQIDAGAKLGLTGDQPLIIVSFGPILVGGTIDAAAVGPSPGPGGGVAALGEAAAGGPAPGGNGLEEPEDFYDAGGGGGGMCGSGGRGGSPGGSIAGSAGEAIRSPVEPLRGGSGGGSGSRDGGDGGAGGGAVQLISNISIVIRGAIEVSGGGGQGGQIRGAGGAGGSGGAVFLQAPSVAFEGGGFARAAGGGGGGGARFGVGDGQNGQDGSLAADRAQGGPGEPSSGDGGRGAGGGNANGDNGETSGGNGGGAGGGIGCIFVGNDSGAEPVGRDNNNPADLPGFAFGALTYE